MIKIKVSERNTNKHTDKGMELLETSIKEVGVIESISVAKNGTIISGHARKEQFDKNGLVPKEITLNANEYPVIVRSDIEDDSQLYYKAQILANTTAHHNYNLDIEEVEVLAEEFDFELEDVGVEVLDLDLDLDKFFEEDNNQKENKNKIVLEYTDEDFEKVTEALKLHTGSKEQIFFKLLGL